MSPPSVTVDIQANFKNTVRTTLEILVNVNVYVPEIGSVSAFKQRLANFKQASNAEYEA